MTGSFGALGLQIRGSTSKTFSRRRITTRR